MLDNPFVLVLLLIALCAIGGYVIYLVLRPKPKDSSKRTYTSRQDATAAEVNKVLLDAHIGPAGKDFQVGRAGANADGQLDSDALLTAEALSKRLEQDAQRKHHN